MSNCSSSSCGTTPSRKHACPVNGVACSEVSTKAILHHIQDPWKWAGPEQRYYFCEDPNCDVVYFGEDGLTISKSQMRGTVGIKDASADSLVCYCFGVSKQAAESDPSLKEYVIQKTRLGLCACETSNPSGRCCLKDFPRHRDTKG